MTINRIKFTKRWLAELKPPTKSRRFYYDTEIPNLCIAITQNNCRTFYVYRKIKGQPIRFRIGRAADWTIQNARKKARWVITEWDNGRDPQKDRQGRRQEMTFGALYVSWIDTSEKLRRPKTVKEYRRCWEQNLKKLKNRRLTDISPNDVVRLHAQKGKDAPYAANRLLAQIKAIYNFGKRPPLSLRIDNPADGIEKFKEEARDRFLQPNEVSAFFASLSEEKPDWQAFFTLCLFTGARRSNVLAMRWKQLDLSTGIWRIPVTKSGGPQIVHLTKPAVQILRKRAGNGSEWVFPSHSKVGHIVEPRVAWQRIVVRAGIDDLKIHDLRRTLASWMANNNVSLQIIGKALGHKSQQSTETYARLGLEPVRQSVDAAAQELLSTRDDTIMNKNINCILKPTHSRKTSLDRIKKAVEINCKRTGKDFPTDNDALFLDYKQIALDFGNPSDGSEACMSGPAATIASAKAECFDDALYESYDRRRERLRANASQPRAWTKEEQKWAEEQWQTTLVEHNNNKTKAAKAIKQQLFDLHHRKVTERVIINHMNKVFG